ncbi:MAG: aminotransferase class I/II-fold pyridoxal phosphate-dependent enzyme [Clostridia bacterium]|nr:aminotransferase class I/II-fold pyridoxal phosphate-dependent enzyme [Clostridia bacterium]
MFSFESDYTEGAHPLILDALVRTNFEQLSGYGFDKYSDSAKEKIKKACGLEDAQVFLLAGGTQTNQIVVDTMLQPYEGAVSTTTGHIEGHEAGAVEFTGHKVLTVPHHLGKMKADDLKNLLETFYADDNHDHMVFPGMVYISHPSEYGTLYTLDELTAISDICRKYEIPLFLDGARLGYGLMSSGTDVTLKDIARLCDVFYIGGTKVGALCGEAVVFTHNNAPKHFFTSIKQHGALLAKGRLLGVQFDTLFTDDLYFKIAKNAIDKADRMRKAFVEKGYKIFIETVTNQIFIVLENSKMQELKKSVSFGFWEKYDDNHTVVRFASSWATTDEAVDKLIELL